MSQRNDSPPPRAMGQLQADDPSDIGTTIVGGQPPGPRRKKVSGVPVGIERVLYAAAVDPEFRARLLAEREEAAKSRGFTLRDSELAILRLTPAAQLKSAIDGLDTTEHSLKRRTFMRAVAASVVTLAAADTLGACGEEAVKGIRPDSGFDSGGIRPDTGGADMTLEIDSGEVDRGIRPDAQADMELEVDGPEASWGIRPDGGE